MSFGTLLVANRGEIALRIFRTARAVGLRTVAVYSDADADAPHVRAADVAVRLGPAPAAESYLSIPALLAAARRSGADAVHPGYGFLSERAAFARACEEAGLAFVGPPADVIELMGRKDEARRIAVAADVPVVPAVEDTSDGDSADSRSSDAALAIRVAAEVGLPALVKAVAGGGGKGMRVVRLVASLPGAIAAARREARSAFGDGRVLVERYVERGRHIEVQVLADTHGGVLHLGERDCSVQRRYQKVVEEAPAPTISAAVRDAVTGAAVRLARKVGYVGAGTVEFLVAGEQVFFLEMNTRLQVEHPVTEAITGLDLVALQLLVARGEPLPLTQDQVIAAGHAIEARIYAEDPRAGFLPQSGTATAVRWPDGVRVDAGLETGQRVDVWYDPMLAKVIAHGPTRAAALVRMAEALDGVAIAGLTTNTGFLRRLVASPAFAAAEIDTAWLDRAPGAFAPTTPPEAWCLAAWALADALAGDPHHPFALADGWRLGGPPTPVRVDLDHDGERRELRVDRAGGVVTDGADGLWRLRPLAGGDGWLRVELDGVVERAFAAAHPDGVEVILRGESYRFRRPDPLAPTAAGAEADGRVTAPMPGVVTAVNVQAGQDVAAGDVLGVLEAMKMEHSLTAPVGGRVTSVEAAPGDRVPLGHVLFAITPDSPDNRDKADHRHDSGDSRA